MFYVAMAAAAVAVDLVFGALDLIPQERSARMAEEVISWDYTTWLNIGFLVVGALLVVRFLRTGGPAMLRMMAGEKVPGSHR